MANADVRKAVQDKLGEAQDDLHRAEAFFKDRALDEQHGASGLTKQQILDGYRSNVKRWEVALASLGAAQATRNTP